MHLSTEGGAAAYCTPPQSLSAAPHLILERPSERTFPQEETPEPKEQSETTGCNGKRFFLLSGAQVPVGARVYLEDLHALRRGRGSFIWKRVAEAGIQKQKHGYRNPIGQFK